MTDKTTHYQQPQSPRPDRDAVDAMMTVTAARLKVETAIAVTSLRHQAHQLRELFQTLTMAGL